MATERQQSPEEIVLGEFKQYLSGRRSKRMGAAKKPAGESKPVACAACEKGDCDDPAHLDPDVLEKLGAMDGPDEAGKGGERDYLED